MSTSYIGEISFIEVYGNVYGLNFMLEKYNKKSSRKHHNVVVKRNHEQPENFILPGPPHLILQGRKMAPISVFVYNLLWSMLYHPKLL